ncbi:Serine/threonine-protein kinase PrkC [Stieleria varia]|uniref:non-specific serine/threonine protein kinase n=2 Tax=Stieleria varia TaxID=2528005 RepID=A0A5C6B6V6_9BACT|nr:Serine/threonine-protein kinase PrkC [Stieleria varia]
MSDNEPTIDLSIASQIDAICDEFEAALKADERPQVGEFVDRLTATVDDRRRLAVELISLDRDYSLSRGETPEPDRYQLPEEIRDAVQQAFSTGSKTVRESNSAEMATIAPDGPAPFEPSLGDRIRYFGDYELLSEIARGGMGVVYKAKQISLNRVIALKMILSGQIAGENEIRRFQLEAESAANLDHPGIVPIYDIGEHNGQHYFSMKLIEGKTLTELSPELRGDHGKIVQLVVQIADAIHHAHQRGILHRDLKPGNVLIDGDGMPMVTDFGLARKLESGEQLTQTGAVVGTPGFMSPEQASGKGVTTSTDIYSLGAILYQLLCGRPPHASETVLDTLMSVISDPPTRPRQCDAEIPADLELIVLKSLEKDPANRYNSAAAFAADLKAFDAGELLSVRPPTAVEVAKSWMKNNVGNVMWVPVIASAVGVLVGFSLWASTFGGSPENHRSAIDTLNPDSTPALMSSLFGSLRGFFMSVLMATSSVAGLLTAKFVKTKSRFGDVLSGLSVGLLAGLIGLVAGMGPVITTTYMYGNGPQSMGEDLELLGSLAAYGKDGRSSLIRDYPAVSKLASNEVSWALVRKIKIALQYKSLTGMWVATFIVLVMFATIGVVQTVVAGSLLRAHSLGRALFSYGCFAFALVTASILFWIDVSTLMISGDHYYIRWTLPVVCFIASLLLIMAVIRRWHMAILSGTLIGVLCLTVMFFQQQFFVIQPPAIMALRSSINHELRRIQRNPEDIAPRQELVYERMKMANYLASVGWSKESAEVCSQALSDLRELDAMDSNSVANLDKGVRRDVMFSSASHMFLTGKDEQGLELLDELEQWLGVEAVPFRYRAEQLARLNRYDEITQRLKSVTFGKDDSAETIQQKGLAIQRTMEFVRRKRGQTIQEMRSWRQSIVDSILPRAADNGSVVVATDAAATKPESASDADEILSRNQNLRQWLLQSQVWKLSEPFDLADPTSIQSLERELPGQRELLSNPSDVVPSKTVEVEVGAPIWFRPESEDTRDSIWDREDAAVLAWTTFEIVEAQTLLLKLCSDDGMQVWLDGRTLLSSPQARGLYNSTTTVRFPVEPGQHTLVVKVTQAKSEWGLSADLFDELGAPLPVWGAADD